jgi:hypothetical protein
LDHFLNALSWVAIHLGTGEAMDDVSMANNCPFARDHLPPALSFVREVVSIKLDGNLTTVWHIHDEVNPVVTTVEHQFVLWTYLHAVLTIDLKQPPLHQKNLFDGRGDVVRVDVTLDGPLEFRGSALLVPIKPLLHVKW